MKLSDLLNSDLIFLNLPCKTHDELLHTLIYKLYDSGRKLTVSQEAVFESVTARENLRGTLLPTGLSVPHARIENCADFYIVIGVPESPIPPFRGDVHFLMMVLTLTPTSASTQYLNALSAFAKISGTPLFEELRKAKDGDDFISLIKSADVNIPAVLTVASIMNNHQKALKPENTVRDAMDLFYRDRLGYVPVMDNNDNFVGELTMTDLFAICIPEYALKMQNLKFLSNFSPLEDLLKNENNLRVGDVMKKPSITLDEDSPVVEAVLKFVQHRRRYLPVMKNGTHLVGVVGYMDVLKKVLRA
ncbi:MAG: hypothetical protein Ta2G_15660 [Termitinemataceae bacterium]|nr:MAG: hypothetical protein Ta2G_15660 [Termitinemataceae bacterium]